MYLNKNTPFNNSQERSQRAISLLVILFMIFIIFYTTTLAWFGETKYVDTNQLTIAGMDLKLMVDKFNGQPPIEITKNDTFSFDNIKLEPSKSYANIKASLLTNEYVLDETNNSQLTPLKAFVRINLNITSSDLSPNEKNLLQLAFGNQLQTWFYDSDQNYFYYNGYITYSQSIEFDLKAIQNITRDHIGKNINFTITVDSLQASYLNFDDLSETVNPNWQNLPATWVASAKAKFA